MSYTKDEHIIPRNVEQEMKESYLRYSMSVIISRALPDVRDGLKPSQRRILYAMKQLNLGPLSKHRKCAKICGDTSGDYHPHGESVIYPTLARLAQDWVMRYPLIQGQGNFGSIDGDPPAQMRYTEARMTSSAVMLMEDLEKDTVDLVPNYDETKKEPVVFPSKFPNLLCNGSSGIAVGMATNIPPHNLKELAEATKLILNNREASIADIMEVMPGPDFPTGGIISGRQGIKDTYLTGRGKLILRALMHVEEPTDTGDRFRVVVDELPYNVNKSRLIEDVARMVHDKVLTGIADIRDESDKEGMRIVFDLKRGESAEVVINQLYKFSDLRVTFGCNILALDKGLPRTMNIKSMIQAWIEHRIEVVRRRVRFDLNKAEARAHVLEGYLKAIDQMDAVVKTIRASNNKEEAKLSLITQFSFTEKQAIAVLDLRLYQLTGLERDKIQEEYEGLLKDIEYYRAVLMSETMVKDIICQELNEVVEKHHSDRKTRIEANSIEMEEEDLIANESVIITISNDDYIKRMPLDTFKEQHRGGQGVLGMQMKKEEDVVKNIYVASTHDYLMIFTNFGRCYWLKVWQLPEAARRSKGKAIVNLIEGISANEKITAVINTATFDQGGFLLLVTQRGVIKKSALTEFSHPRKKGVYAINIDEGDEVIAAKLVNLGQQIMLFTKQGMAVRFNEEGVRPLGRVARGVRGVMLKKEEDRVVSCEVVCGTETILVVCENGYGKRSVVEDFRQTNRGGSGVRSIITSERNGGVVGALSVEDSDSLLLMSSAGHTIRIRMNEVRVMGRNTQGVRLVNLKEEDLLVALQKLTSEEEASIPLPDQNDA